MIQYWMYEKIMRFLLDELYELKFIVVEVVKVRLLKDFDYEMEDNEEIIEFIVFIDIQGGDFFE